MTLNEAIERFEHNAEFERRNGNLQGCLEFRQLVEWLSALQEYKDVLDKIRAEMGRCKTLHEMQLSERDTKGKLLISDIFCDVVEILDRYRNEVSEE